MGESFVERIGRVTNAFMESKIVLLGVSLGLFDRLARGPATVEQLVTDLEVTARGIEILADALTSCGYLTKNDGAYANTDDVNTHLVRGAEASQAYIVGHRNQMFGTWAALDETIRHGQKREERAKPTLTDPESNRNFILGMAEVSRGRVGPILDRLPLDGARLLVDVGGGPAQCACEAVRRHNGLEAVVVDLPLTVEVARTEIARHGLEERVRAVVCDFYHEPAIELDGAADVALVANVVHAEGVEENLALLKKIRAIVADGGWIAVAENLANEDRSTPPAAAMFAVNMLAGTARGRTFTEAEITGWLRDAGFAPKPAEQVGPRTSLILAQKR